MMDFRLFLVLGALLLKASFCTAKTRRRSLTKPICQTDSAGFWVDCVESPLELCCGDRTGPNHGGDSCPLTPADFEEVKPVTTRIGRNITLQCIITKILLKEDDHVGWSKDGGDEIFIVKNGKQEIQNKSNENRLCLAVFNGVLSGHDASLNISDVKVSDEGSYCCCIKSANLHCINQTLVVQKESSTTPDPHRLEGSSPHPHSASPPQNISCMGFTSCCIVGVILTLFLLIGILAYFGKTCCNNGNRKKPNRRKSSDFKLTKVSSEDSSLIIEDLNKQIADLKSMISSRDETIRQLESTIHGGQEDIQSMGAGYQHDKSTTIQRSCESFKDFPGHPNQPSDLHTKTTKIPGDHNLKKNPLEHAKPVQQKLEFGSVRCRMTTRPQST